MKTVLGKMWLQAVQETAEVKEAQGKDKKEGGEKKKKISSAHTVLGQDNCLSVLATVSLKKGDKPLSRERVWEGCVYRRRTRPLGMYVPIYL